MKKFLYRDFVAIVRLMAKAKLSILTHPHTAAWCFIVQVYKQCCCISKIYNLLSRQLQTIALVDFLPLLSYSAHFRAVYTYIKTRIKSIKYRGRGRRRLQQENKMCEAGGSISPSALLSRRFASSYRDTSASRGFPHSLAVAAAAAARM